MAGPLSFKEGVSRTVAAVLLAGVGLIEAKQPPLACGDGEIYPDGVMPPATAEYEIEIPKKNGCAVWLYRDDYHERFLAIYTDRTEVVSFDNIIGRAYVQRTGKLPKDGETVEFSWAEFSGSLTREGDIYRVRHTGPESIPPAPPPEPEQLFRYCEPPGESLAAYNEKSQGSCFVEKMTDGDILVALVEDEYIAAGLSINAGDNEVSVSLVVIDENGQRSPVGGVAPKPGQVFEMEYNGLVVTIRGLENGYYVTYTYKPTPKRQQPPGWPNAPFGEEVSA